MGADEYFEGIKSVNPQLLEIMGRRYVIESCISALNSKHEEMMFRVYVTDALRALCRSNGARYFDLISRKADTRQDAEVVNDIKDKMRGLNDESAELGCDTIA